MITYVPNGASEYRSIACLCSLIFFAFGAGAGAQPAPAPFRIVTELTAEGVTLSALTARSAQDPRDIQESEAKWLQIVFGDFNLGAKSVLKIEGVDNRQFQTFDQEYLEAWGGVTARFRDTHLRLSVEVDPVDEADEIFYEIELILLGEPLEFRLPDIPGMLHGFEEDSAPDERPCDNVDDRDKSEDKRVGRLMPIGCTAWIIGKETLLSAGHCAEKGKLWMSIVEFNVPDSNPDRSTIPAAIADQYAVGWESIDSRINHPESIGNDWAVFKVAANTHSKKLPKEAQDVEQFTLSNTREPERVMVLGYGVDDGADNQTLQKDNGKRVLDRVEDEDFTFITYTADVAGGTSGAPVVAEDGTGEAIGIHNSHCVAIPNRSIGTSFRNAELWQAIQEFNSR